MVCGETNDPAVIVMLTRTYEGFREKCYQYWSEEHKEYNCPGFSCSLTMTDKYFHAKADCTVRQFKLETRSKTATSGSSTSVSKTVYHLYFENWGDFGAPEKGQEELITELCKLANKLNSANNPLIVHCSAGVGRTGTFIAVDFLQSCIFDNTIDRQEQATDYLVESSSLLLSGESSLAGESANLDSTAENSDPVFDTVAILRRQRMLMVQSVRQYRFLYHILLIMLQDKSL